MKNTQSNLPVLENNRLDHRLSVLRSAHESKWSEILTAWWKAAFKNKPAPDEIEVNKLILAIQYKTQANIYAANNEEVPERFYHNYNAAINYKDYDEYKGPEIVKVLFCNDLNGIVICKSITEKGETLMVKKTETKVEKKTALTVPPPSAKKVVKKLTPSGYTRELLLERKYTDEQICAMVMKKFPDATNFKKDYISITRSDLNKGVYKIVLESPITKIVAAKSVNNAVKKTLTPEAVKKAMPKLVKKPEVQKAPTLPAALKKPILAAKKAIKKA